MNKKLFLPSLLLFVGMNTYAQDPKVISSIIEESEKNSQLEVLAHHLLDVIGPRLVGTPQMKQANDWVASKYSEWGIGSNQQKFGEWRGWERGVTHIDLISPRVRSLEGTQLAWSPSLKKQNIEAEAVVMPDFKDEADFKAWLPSVKGKLLLVSMNHLSGRPEKNWEEFATKESFEKYKKDKKEAAEQYAANYKKTGFTDANNAKSLILAAEAAGAAGIVINNWSQGFGVDKIFGAATKGIPTLNLSLEDYGLVYRLAKFGSKPKLKVRSESKELGLVPNFNTIGEIKGNEKPKEYVLLSAHLDSWDGSSGATDNGSGTIMMMEVMRVLKKFYPNPKRTILAGHWGSEEQGLNGSRAFVEDNPEVVKNLQAVFNQDNGTGRVINLSAQGFSKAGQSLNKWLAMVPDKIREQIKTVYPGLPSGGGSDHASFVSVGAPGFSLSSLNWDYGVYTWHTNRDSYDKLVFDEIRNNVILAAIMVYMACEDPEMINKEKASNLKNERTGEAFPWPEQKKATRKGGLD